MVPKLNNVRAGISEGWLASALASTQPLPGPNHHIQAHVKKKRERVVLPASVLVKAFPVPLRFLLSSNWPCLCHVATTPSSKRGCESEIQVFSLFLFLFLFQACVMEGRKERDLGVC